MSGMLALPAPVAVTSQPDTRLIIGPSSAFEAGETVRVQLRVRDGDPTTLLLPEPYTENEVDQIHFVVAESSSGPWAIRVATGGQTVWSSSARHTAADSFWSGTIGRRSPELTIEADGQGTVELVIDQVMVTTHPASEPQMVVGTDDRKPILDESRQVIDWGAAVARLKFQNERGKREYCTAFLVSGELMLTNQHCITDDAVLTSAEAQFDFDVPDREGCRHGSNEPNCLQFSELVLADFYLDYALLRLDRLTGRTPLAIAPDAIEEARKDSLQEAPGPRRVGFALIQHPNGKAKTVSIEGCAPTGRRQGNNPRMRAFRGRAGVIPEGQRSVRALGTTRWQRLRTDFRHRCDTDGGASGSAIQDFTTGFVVGLHHGSRESREVNQGVSMALILHDVRTRLESVFDEIVSS